ncbi:hypothetical protein OIU76_020355 [Salix suchowensis]|nr:hypothetical protein OIU76_020355 [Salix suchowensis]
MCGAEVLGVCRGEFVFVLHGRGMMKKMLRKNFIPLSLFQSFLQRDSRGWAPRSLMTKNNEVTCLLSEFLLKFQFWLYCDSSSGFHFVVGSLGDIFSGGSILDVLCMHSEF